MSRNAKSPLSIQTYINIVFAKINLIKRIAHINENEDCIKFSSTALMIMFIRISDAICETCHKKTRNASWKGGAFL